MHVLVIITDITNYANLFVRLAARKEVPGSRGYPADTSVHRPQATMYELEKKKGIDGLDHYADA